MTSYTNDWGLPKPDASDLIAGTSQNLRTAIGALADKTDQSLTQAKAQLEHDAKQYVDAEKWKRGPLPDGTDIDQINTRGNAGLWSNAGSRTYYGTLPPDWDRGNGDFENLANGYGDGMQRFTPYARPYTWERTITSPINYTWTRWRKVGAHDSDELEDRITDLERSANTSSNGLDPARLIAPLSSDPARIVCWGDSLTQAGGLVSRLSELLPDVAVTNRGVSGQTAGQIAARQGGEHSLMTITGNQIPTSGSVSVTSRTQSLLAQTGYPARSEAGTLAGVHGTLSNEDGSTSYTFTRTTSGDPVECPPGTPFITGAGREARDATQVIWAGRNNISLGLYEWDLAMAVHLTPAEKRFLILSATNSDDETEGTERYELFMEQNRALARDFGDRFLDIRRWLIDHGLDAAGITPTQEDLAAIAGDAIPRSLTTGDGIHFTNAVQRLIGEQIHDRMVQLGWYA